MRSDPAIRARIAARYKDQRNLAAYARGKLALDPAYAAVRRQLAGSDLPLLDIGCGIGLLAGYLRENGCRFPIAGIDLCEDKIRVARQVIQPAYPNVDFAVANAADYSGFHGNVVLLDVIHYFDDRAQAEFLHRVAGMVAPGGTLLIRTGIRDGSLRYWITQIEEFFVRTTRWIVGGAWNFPSVDEVASPFRQLGFSESIAPLWGRTPFNSYLFEFTRKG